MTSQEILEGNRTIAEFMGYTPEYLSRDELRITGHGTLSYGSEFMVKRDDGFLTILGLTQNLGYHKDWNQLMSALDKIENTRKKGIFYCDELIMTGKNISLSVKDHHTGIILFQYYGQHDDTVKNKKEAIWKGIILLIEYVKKLELNLIENNI